jgi:hypothetical protein
MQIETQNASSETILSQEELSRSWKVGSVLAFTNGSSWAAELGDRFHFSLPMMLESEVPIYPSESKTLLRYFWKLKSERCEAERELD